MFDSGISVKSLVEDLNAEVDIALDIPDTSYAEWLNSLQQLLYSEIIKEQRKKTIENPSSNVISMPFEVGTNENGPRFEDIYAVYVGKKQLMKTTLASGAIFADTYCKANNDLWINTLSPLEKVEIIYFVKPALVTCNTHKNINEKYEDGTPVNVMVPVEFIDLVKAKLRGEAYKLANEDSLAAKWLNDYNVLLETFKAWVAEKSSKFGM